MHFESGWYHVKRIHRVVEIIGNYISDHQRETNKLINKPINGDKIMTNNNTVKFEIGNTYNGYTVVKRTPCFVTLEDSAGNTLRKKVKIEYGSEIIVYNDTVIKSSSVTKDDMKDVDQMEQLVAELDKVVSDIIEIETKFEGYELSSLKEAKEVIRDKANKIYKKKMEMQYKQEKKAELAKEKELANNVRFLMYKVTNGVNTAKVDYIRSSDEVITVYGSGYADRLDNILPNVIDDSDSMVDYFDYQRVIIKKGDKHWKEVNAQCKRREAKSRNNY